METRTANEARTEWADLIGTVRFRGEAVGITWRGKLVAEVVPDEWFQRAVAAIGLPGQPEPAADEEQKGD